MARIVDEYIGYVWDREKERYVQLGASLAYSYDECKRFFLEHRVSIMAVQYSRYDMTNYHIKIRRITYTDWEVINNG